MFAIQPAGGADGGPAAEKAEQQVSAYADPQQKRERSAGQVVPENGDGIQGGHKPHQAAERKRDQAERDAIAIFPEKVSVSGKRPGDQRADQAGDKNQQRQLEIHHGHGSGAGFVRESFHPGKLFPL